MQKINRRNILQFGALAPLAMTGACATVEGETKAGNETSSRIKNPLPFSRTLELPPFEEMYAAKTDGGFSIPAVPYQKINERYLRQVVNDPTGEKPGTIVVDTRTHHLFLVLPGRKAVRYGVGLGRAGFEWSGRAEVKRKASWPKWHPPEEMIEREPKLEKYRTTYNRETDTYEGGMEGGPFNPLGARALYLYQGNVDTLYRLHGSPEWNSIGKSVSSGCVRLMNQDAIDLHDRAKTGAEVLVR
ncbi:L,D-transpeptidase [Ahrensia marina]|uniref:ErfK/YbiS/YcfS/YnhG family protein n=1 Tax=Ahrensia marina TaxID=1514904 RepID=A0A0M9GNY3_9HYPH|nr:L,D-transpeptidase [Ahrensia marina]KPB02243.1 ErfK/YbiS/YcfS/YnhG family protein [Ahrensia marina]